MITASTYKKYPYMKNDSRKEELLLSFRKACEIHQWNAIAWVVLDNHYHVMVQAPKAGAGSLPKFVSNYHKFTAKRWNDADGKHGRKIWWNYWDTCIRSEKDFIARLEYIHWNPVKHGLVDDLANYSYSSFREFYPEKLDIGKSMHSIFVPRTELEIPDDY